MQISGNGAEDTCFQKNHNEANGHTTNISGATFDVEKAPMNGASTLAAGKSAVDTQILQHSNGIVIPDQAAGPKFDTASIIAPYDDKDDFPEGGLRAWSVVLGSFCGFFSVFGIINSTGVLLDYLSEHQLKGYTFSQIGWIFGFALFLTFFCGAPIGPIFDSYGPRIPMLCGSVLMVASVFLLGECTQYWHFFMAYSLLNGLGGCLINTPCIASIGHFFLQRRGNATGIAMTAGSIGGIIIPLLLQKLLPKVGFAWSMRILGFILFFLLVVANILVRSRLPRKPLTGFSKVAPDLKLFKDIPFGLLTFGIFLMEWGIFVPLTYVTSYATTNGHGFEFGFQILAILNAGSFFGRFFAGILADMCGRVNTLIISIAMCVIACLALWLPAGDSTAMIVVFSLIFGFVSGSNLSLSPVCIGQMCKTENYGAYFSTCWMVVAFGTLSGLPIAGQILTSAKGDYTGLIIFAGMSYTGSMICLVAARVMKVGWKINVIY